MSRPTLSILAALGLLASPLTAQFGTPPPKELAKFDGMLGAWEGSGKVWMTPDAEPMAWTATARYSKVLKGYFIREDTTIDFGMGKLAMIGYLAWDAETKQFRQFGASSMGAVVSARSIGPARSSSARWGCSASRT